MLWYRSVWLPTNRPIPTYPGRPLFKDTGSYRANLLYETVYTDSYYSMAWYELVSLESGLLGYIGL